MDADPALYDQRLQSAGIKNNGAIMNAVTISLQRDGPRWIAQAAPGQQDARRLVVGAVALTAADFGGVQDWRSARALIEWACELVRKNAAGGAAERAFHWAAISLLEAAADTAPLQAHVAHALLRFPSEPRFILARGVATELRTWPDPRDGQTPRDRDPTLVGLTVTRLNEARALEQVSAEALTRLAFMAIRNGNPNEALPYLRDAEAAGPDPFIGYLIQLFKGRALERLGRQADAIDAYRKAVAILPAQTAQLALAVALARSGEHADAVTQAEATTRSVTVTVDPWLAYGRGDGRMWGDIAGFLREQIRSMR
jgi:tetratricopeptide (TPR) repeat protein